MKVLFTYDYGKEKMDQVRKLGYDVDYYHEGSLTGEEDLSDYEILVCYHPFGQIDISKMPNLKYIQLSSIGFDQLPKNICLERGITVMNNQGGYSIPMGEWIVMRMLEILKQTRKIDANQRLSKWKIETSVMELYKKRIVFLGTGTIAHEAVKRLKGFGCDLIGLNRSGQHKEYFDQVYKLSEGEAMLKDADVVVVTLPSTDATRNYLSEDKLDFLRDDAILINVARGELIDEEALIRKLHQGKFKGVALDVFEKEPLNATSPLWQFDNVWISSHNSWVSEMRNIRRFEMILDNLSSIKEGKSLRNVVNIERGY